MSVKWNLIDNSFGHDTQITAGQPNKHVEWLKWPLFNSDYPTFFTNEQIFSDVPKSIFGENTYGILFESAGIIPQIFTLAHSMRDSLKQRFRHIFTYYPKLLAQDPDLYKFAPAYGFQVGGTHAGGTIGIHTKSKLSSMIASGKQFTKLQQERVKLAKFLKEESLTDIYGTCVDKPIKFSADALQDYMFSLVVENCAVENYFTEKILNCFALGTVPIYMGCPNIDKFFNPAGILQIKDGWEWKDIGNIANSVTKEKYVEMLDAVRDNYDRCQSYRSVEDYIYLNYFYAEKP